MILDSIQFVVNGGTKCTAGGQTYASLFGVKIEGVGLIIAQPSTAISSEVAPVTTYQRKSEKPGSLDPQTYILKAVESRFINVYSAQFEVGPFIPAGTRYNITLLGETVTYTAIAGDTPTTVKAGLKALIDANTYSATVTTSYVSGRLRATYISPSDVATCGAESASSALYQSGAYVVYNGDYYLIGNVDSTTTYPTIPPIGLSYDLGDLVLMPLGLKLHISQPSYTEVSYTETSAGTTTITGFITTTYDPGINEVMINEDTNELIFGSVLGDPVTITIIYLR